MMAEASPSLSINLNPPVGCCLAQPAPSRILATPLLALRTLSLVYMRALRPVLSRFCFAFPPLHLPSLWPHVYGSHLTRSSIASVMEGMTSHSCRMIRIGDSDQPAPFGAGIASQWGETIILPSHARYQDNDSCRCSRLVTGEFVPSI
jgi:hypothetical protein